MIPSVTLIVRSRVASAPVAYIRAAIGGISILRAGESWEILTRVYRASSIQTPLVAWLPNPTPVGITTLAVIWAFSALSFMIGWRTRIAGAVMLAAMLYMLLLDQQTYSSHLYFMFLVVLLLTVAESGATFSMDSADDKKLLIPAWPIVLLRLQLSLLYFFGSITKINSSFLSGETLKANIQDDIIAIIPDQWVRLGMLPFMAMLAICGEFILSLIVWARSFRLAAVGFGIVMHLSMVLLVGRPVFYELIVFALTCLVLYGLPFTLTTNEIQTQKISVSAPEPLSS